MTKATLADVMELTDLVNSAYRGEDSKKGWTSEDHLLDGTRVDEQMITAYLTHQDIAILKLTDDGNKIIGTVYLEIKGSKLYLGMLSVSPDVQNKGTGRILLEEAEEYARQHHCTEITITVISARAELINWYERRGFMKSGQPKPFPADFNVGRPKQRLELIEMMKIIE